MKNNLLCRVSTALMTGAIPIALTAAAPAAAQSLTTGQGVADRARPDYDPIGLNTGGFTLFPSVSTTAIANDNYLARDTDKRFDAYLVLQPELYARSNWSRHRLDARAFASQQFHTDLSGDNVSQIGASTSGAYDVSRMTQFRADASIARYVESRAALGTVQDTREPVRFGAYHVGVGASQSFLDLIWNADASYDYRNYSDVELLDGTPLDQDFRNVRVLGLGGSAQYDVRNGIGIIAGIRYDTERYDVRPGQDGFVNGVDLNRQSSGYNAFGGVSLELTRLIFGRVTVGYLNRKYDDPRLTDFGGLSYNADVLWNITQLTTVRFNASRSVENTSSPLIAGNTRSDFRLSADHELYRYVILSGDIGYGSFRPNGPGVGGNEYTAGVAGRYLINRRYTVTGSLRHSGRSSDSRFLRYDANIASLGLRAAF